MVQEESGGNQAGAFSVTTLNPFIRRLQKNIVMFGFGSGLMILGSLLVVDDALDFGLFSFEGHPSWIHHWWIGLLLLIGGILLTALSLLIE